MKHWFIIVFVVLFVLKLNAQTHSQKASVLAQASIQMSPWPAIKLSWQDDFSASKWTIYRKNRASNKFELLASVNAPDTTYLDEDVDVGLSYTYLIHKEDVNKVMGFTVISAGISTKRSFEYGTCLLIVERDLEKNLSSELSTLQIDLRLEGWQVIVKYQNANDKPTDMKKTIVDAYTESDSTLSSVILIGDLPVAYSGNIAPDGHTAAAPPDHQGAWPSDAYFADINGLWSDDSVSINNTPARVANNNKRNDGKFDQSHIPGRAELMLGRINLEGFDDFEEDRIELYKRYFNRNHAYRTAQYNGGNKAIVNDGFANLIEGFAGIGYRNFGQMVGNEKVTQGTLLENAIDEKVLLAYGCGPGDYQKCGRRLRNNNGQRVDSFSVSQTSDYFNYNINCSFNILFGSFFGDWDNDNNLLRAPLAGNSPALATFWAGRPVWHLNDFAHGKPLGQSLLMSQNSDIELFSSIESVGTYEKMVHVALMGDPTIHLRNISPLNNLSVATNEPRDSVFLNWDAAENQVSYIFSKINDADSSWNLLTNEPISENRFTDADPKSGNLVYKVVPAEIYESNTGSFEVFGHFDTVSINDVKLRVGSNEVSNPSFSLSLFPNPAQNIVIVKTEKTIEKILVADITGKVVFSAAHLNSIQTRVDVSKFPSGMYQLMVSRDGFTQTKTLVVNH